MPAAAIIFITLPLSLIFLIYFIVAFAFRLDGCRRLMLPLAFRRRWLSPGCFR